VEKRTYRQYSNLDTVSVDTVDKYLKLVEECIDKNLKEELPTKFGLVIDGWTEGTTHYYGVFAAYPKDGKNYTRFLTMAPPLDESKFTAKTQADFLVDVIENVGRTKEDILFLVADNTNTNPATADLLNVPFVGCASHRFNLAVQKYVDKHNAVIANIHQIMLLLSNLKKAGKFRKLTNLEPVIMNQTRWSSKHAMVERYLRLEETIKEMDDIDLNVLLPSGREVSELKMLRQHLCEFNIITKQLQDPSISLLDVRLIFDEVIGSYPEMEFYLAKDAKIVKHPSFESAICKVISNQQSLLDFEERRYLLPFVRLEEVETVEDQNIVQRALKRKRTNDVDLAKYGDLTYIPPTSDVCERLFSAAR
jgi:hypothetical protein